MSLPDEIKKLWLGDPLLNKTMRTLNLSNKKSVEWAINVALHRGRPELAERLREHARAKGWMDVVNNFFKMLPGEKNPKLNPGVRKNPYPWLTLPDPLGRLMLFQQEGANQRNLVPTFPLSALEGTRSQNSPDPRRGRFPGYVERYVQETHVWAKPPERPGRVYFVRSLISWLPDYFKAFVRARSANAARAAFANYSRWDWEGGVVNQVVQHMPTPEVSWQAGVANHVYHLTLPDSEEEMLNEVAQLIYANDATFRRSEKFEREYSVELVVEYSLHAADLGFKPAGKSNQDSAIRFTPTLVDGKFGVVINELADAWDAINTWKDAARRGVDFLTARRDAR